MKNMTIFIYIYTYIFVLQLLLLLLLLFIRKSLFLYTCIWTWRRWVMVECVADRVSARKSFSSDAETIAMRRDATRYEEMWKENWDINHLVCVCLVVVCVKDIFSQYSSYLLLPKWESSDGSKINIWFSFLENVKWRGRRGFSLAAFGILLSRSVIALWLVCMLGCKCLFVWLSSREKNSPCLKGKKEIFWTRTTTKSINLRKTKISLKMKKQFLSKFIMFFILSGLSIRVCVWLCVKLSSYTWNRYESFIVLSFWEIFKNVLRIKTRN